MKWSQLLVISFLFLVCTGCFPPKPLESPKRLESAPVPEDAARVEVKAPPAPQGPRVRAKKPVSRAKKPALPKRPIQSTTQSTAQSTMGPASLFGLFEATIKKNISTIHPTNARTVMGKLKRAIQSKSTYTEFLTSLAETKGDGHVLPKAAVREIHKAYDLHGLFMLEGKDTSDNAFSCDFLAWGRGWVFIGYDRACTIYNPDYDAKYDYPLLVRLKVGTSSVGEKGFVSVEGIYRQDGAYKPIRGPLNAEILGVFLNGKSERPSERIVSYFLWETETIRDQVPMNRRSKDLEAPSSSDK